MGEERFVPRDTATGQQMDRAKVLMVIEPLLGELLKEKGDLERGVSKIKACMNAPGFNCNRENLTGFVREMVGKKVYESVLQTRTGKGNAEEVINDAMKRFDGLLDKAGYGVKSDLGVKEAA